MRKYKFTSGIQHIEMDTPDYSKAYEIKAEGNARNKGLSQAASMFAGGFAPIGQVGGMASEVIRNRAKNKRTGSVAGGALEMGASGAALGMQLGGPWGALAGATIGGIYGGVKGKKDYEKIKAVSQEEERIADTANFNKQFREGASTDAQSFIAKKGKYKLKTKQPRLIETEGREPIFSPKKADGTRDLLYYNPNDPTHEEGGVKAVVMPKAQEGKRETKVAKQPDILDDTDSWTENVGELFDPSGVSSWDDAYRALKNVYNNPKEKGLYTQAAFETLGAIPVIGKMRSLIKAAKALNKANKVIKATKAAKNADKATNWADLAGDAWTITSSMLPELIGDPFNYEGLNYQKGTFNGRNIFPQFRQTYRNMTKAYGAKQLKVNNLNNTALSQNLGGMPAANAANNFMQPTTGIQQVARNIPQERRQEKRNTPRSHKKTVGPVKTVEPPMLYEMKPPPPRSTFNTKNDFKKGGKYIKTYQIGTDGTEANATYKHSKTFKDRMAYQEASKAHDDSLSLYKQSRYFTNLVNKSNLYQPTVENPPVKNVVRTGKSTVTSPTKTFGAPDDRSESFITIAGYNPVRKDLHSRKESKYKSFKEYEDAKAAGKNDVEHEGYEINMYKHPEMAVNYDPDTVSPIKVRTPKLKIPKDSIVTQTPKQVVIPNTKTPTKDKEEVVTNKPRGKFIAKEKTTLEKLGEKASEFFNKIGSSNRPVNGRRITVFK